MTNDAEVERERSPQLKDKITQVRQGVERTLYFCKNAAIVNVSEAGVSPQEIVDDLPDRYHHVSVQEILDGKAEWPRDKSALVLTGYSDELYEDLDGARDVESFVRTDWRVGRTVLILADSMPPGNLLWRGDAPWHNGPFEGDDAVWSIRPGSGGELEMARHKTTRKYPDDPEVLEKIYSWEDKEVKPLDNW